MKEGTVQIIKIFADNEQKVAKTEPKEEEENILRLLERFRHRKDKMATRETYPDNGR